MKRIVYRLGKPSDAAQIAFVHYHIRDKYNQGFFAQVNYSFLVQYYKVVLENPYEIVVCAEDENKQIVGFSSGSLDSRHLFVQMRRKKFRFVLPLLMSAILNPKLIKSAVDRFKSTKGKSENEYVKSDGARVEYWGWLPGREDSDQSIVMQDILFYIMKLFGADHIYFEVDRINKRIFKFHRINGAEEIKTFILPDGRERVELMYDMNKYSFKIK